MVIFVIVLKNIFVIILDLSALSLSCNTLDLHCDLGTLS